MSEAETINSPAVPEFDWTLQALSNFAEVGIKFGITLTVGGTAITGQIIAGRTFAKLMADQIHSATSGLESEGIGAHIASIYEAIQSSLAVPEPRPSDWAPPPSDFVHLEDATIFHGGDETRLGLWRGRLSEVQGYSFGELKRA